MHHGMVKTESKHMLLTFVLACLDGSLLQLVDVVQIRLVVTSRTCCFFSLRAATDARGGANSRKEALCQEYDIGSRKLELGHRRRRGSLGLRGGLQSLKPTALREIMLFPSPHPQPVCAGKDPASAFHMSC